LPAAAHRCFDDFKAHVRYRSIELDGEDRVAVIQNKAVSVIRGNGLTQLLEGPSRSRMGSKVKVNDSAGNMLYDYQQVEDSKGGTRYDEEVAGDDGPPPDS
jgi:hypothetical protein